LKIIVSAPSSHPAVRWVAHGLVGRGHNVEFFTTLALAADTRIDGPMFPAPLRRELGRRRLPGNLVSNKVQNVGITADLIRVVLERSNKLRMNLAVHRRMIRQVQKAVIRRIEEDKPDFVIATGSMNDLLAEYCFLKKIPLIIYLPQPVMGLVRKLDSAQADNMLPEETVKAAELFAATHFLASSSFVSESLRDAGLTQPIIRHPLGFPTIETQEKTRVWNGPTQSGAFKILFVGRASDQKGLPYLLDAVRLLQESGRAVELLAVTREVDKLTQLVREAELSTIVSVVPPMPRAELFSTFRNSDVFVLPSIFEGYGLVIVEALANALPVISTPLTAAADLNINESSGFVIPAKSSEAIFASVVRLMDNPALHRQFSEAAVACTLNKSWDSYASEVSADVERAITDYLDQNQEVAQ
jgi:glycosyltransferase involved in cell wall biosynthesis